MEQLQMSEAFSCRVCGSKMLDDVHGFSDFARITSDCKLFPAGGRLAECADCGAVQALKSFAWLAETEEIYRHYAPYHQTGGVEQLVMDKNTGTLRRRSDLIISRLSQQYKLTEAGRALDVGCGSGVTLRALSKQRPGWQLFGHDLDEQGRERLRSIPGFTAFFTCSPGEIQGTFDLVTMVHSLEHFPDPLDTLRQLLSRLAPNGRLFIQVPNAAENPFELVIADHMMHFTAETLKRIVQQAGYAVDTVETIWVTKELSLVASPPLSRTSPDRVKMEKAAGFASSATSWLRAVIDNAADSADKVGSFGVFGTSIAGTWLAGTLGDKVDFFVDEDPSCEGREHLGRPTFTPERVPREARVYMALVPKIAAAITERLKPLGIQFINPPPLSE